MSRSIGGFLILSVFAPAVAAAEGTLPIRDSAKLFSPEAIARAVDQVSALRRSAHFDFALETADTLAPEVVEDLGRSSNAHRIFSEIAQERAESADVHGVFVLISTMPQHRIIAVIVRPEECREFFTERNRDQLRKLLDSKLKKNPDEALSAAITLVRDKVAAHQKEDSSWFGWGTVLLFVGGLLGLWLLLGLLRMRLNTTAENNQAGPPGFVPGLLGGMFGSAAGLWIYDTFFLGPQQPPAGAPDAAHAEASATTRPFPDESEM